MDKERAMIWDFGSFACHSICIHIYFNALYNTICACDAFVTCVVSTFTIIYVMLVVLLVFALLLYILSNKLLLWYM